MIDIDKATGKHSATITQRELATLRVIAQHSDTSQRISDALAAIAGDCGNDNCEACSLDGDDAHDVRYELYGVSHA